MRDCCRCLFSSANGQRLRGGPWDTLYGHPLFDVTWSRTSHLVALCSYGGNHPIIVLAAERGDEAQVAQIIEEDANVSRAEQQERTERKRERRRRRMQEKVRTYRLFVGLFPCG